METGAHFSDCGQFRYALWRIWDKNKPLITFIGLNPSTADQTYNDPTIRRCIEFAKSSQFGGLYMINLFAFKATDSKVMLSQQDPVGPDNDEWIQKIVGRSKLVVASWGNEGSNFGRSSKVVQLLAKNSLHYLKLNKTGEPGHPLYIRKDTKIKPMDIERYLERRAL